MALPRRFLLSALCLVLACHGARAVTQDEVVAGAAKLYRERIVELADVGMLDRDPAFLARMHRIVQRLDEQATRDDPGRTTMAWEIHASSDADDNASCMAGGKLLLSQPYIERLGLNDAELAMILSHEMQHALLLHNLKEYEEALRLAPDWHGKPFAELEDAVDNDSSLMQKLAPLNKAQEVEADTAGMAMAWRAGWRAAHLAGYFRKLEQASAMSYIGSATHPSPLQRWRAARAQAALLDRRSDDAPKK
ncbi:MAG TPA: M48 family metalloprotease [Telluria sp.]|jgi:predicted Zn-dependent protease